MPQVGKVSRYHSDIHASFGRNARVLQAAARLPTAPRRKGSYSQQLPSCGTVKQDTTIVTLVHNAVAISLGAIKEDMATLQEAAVFSDVLMNGGENQLGLETFARTAANAANSNIRYDFARYRNPWAARRETPATAAIRKAWERHAPWTKRQRGRLALLQQRGDVPLATQARKRAAPKANTKKAAKRTAAAPKRAAAPPLLVQK